MTAPISNEPTTTRLHHYAGHYSRLTKHQQHQPKPTPPIMKSLITYLFLRFLFVRFLKQCWGLVLGVFFSIGEVFCLFNDQLDCFFLFVRRILVLREKPFDS